MQLSEGWTLLGYCLYRLPPRQTLSGLRWSFTCSLWAFTYRPVPQVDGETARATWRNSRCSYLTPRLDIRRIGSKTCPRGARVWFRVTTHVVASPGTSAPPEGAHFILVLPLQIPYTGAGWRTPLPYSLHVVCHVLAK